MTRHINQVTIHMRRCLHSPRIFSHPMGVERFIWSHCMSLAQVPYLILTRLRVADLLGSLALCRQDMNASLTHALTSQSSFTLDWSILVSGSLIFFHISCNILFAHFQVADLQPSKIKFTDLFKPRFELNIFQELQSCTMQNVKDASLLPILLPSSKERGI